MRHAKILIVEDEPLVAEILSIILGQGGYAVLQAKTAEGGIGLAVSDRPDLILMDIQLPGMDGLEATRILKQNPDTAAIPIVALSAQAMREDVERAYEVGCEAYITKPFETQDLLRTIRGLTRGAPP